ncbi:ABC transporter ATP-binding protein [Paraburkholderia sp. J12]|uniref:ABC transporter ATP-binding protein n=1 Tax=Paraburkholderia sp. J12 TaxID=2805432 RepID=UPI002ABE5FB4|nr:ABC transporter ATP-binding protein [Paraburkholderia sp. J12]
MIEFTGLSKRYGEVQALHPLDLRVARGELFGFLGPNGAGKTTTILMMIGQLVPTSGTVRIDGLDCRGDDVEVKRRIGYLPDNPIFYDYLRGHEILQFVAEMQGLSRTKAKSRTEQLLAEFGLDTARDEFAVNYSMGMKKKLGLACALIHEPSVLILDEPINGLDPRAARDVNDRLIECASRGMTIFMSTHLLDIAERLCSRVAIIHHGKLAATGTLDEIRAATTLGGSLEDVFLSITTDSPQGEASR